MKNEKAFLIVGAGKLGTQVCKYLYEKGLEIMLVDSDEDKIRPYLHMVTRAQVGDLTDVDTIKSIGVDNFDACIVCITEFQSSLEVTDLLKENGAKYVVSQAVTDIQSKFLLRSGADKVIYPDRDVAERLAVSISNDNIFDYFEISEDCSLFELTSPKMWLGKSIAKLNIRREHNVSIIGYKKNGKIKMIRSADYVFNTDEHIMVLGKREDVEKLLEN